MDGVCFEQEVVEALESEERDPAFAEVADDELVELARRAAADVAAATCRWMVLLGEIVRRGVWAAQGASTPTQWLGWAVSMGESTAREHVRVSLRLRRFPRTLERFAQGELSYSKVRAITRLNRPELEELLLEYAQYATGSQLERIVRGFQGVERAQEQERRDPWERRELWWQETGDGMVELRVRLPVEVGLEVVAALDREADRLRDDPPALPADAGEPTAAGTRPSRVTLRADAVVTAARVLAERGGEDASGEDRHLLVIHAETDDLADPGPGKDRSVPVETNLARRRRPSVVSVRALRRMACQGRYVVVGHDHANGVVGISGSTRRIPRRLRRLLIVRDKGCRFPGCIRSRGLEAHHIVEVLDGGQTVLDNLVLLCAFHHHWIHAKGWQILTDGQGRFRFRPPGEPVMPAVLPLRTASAEALAGGYATDPAGLQARSDLHPPDYSLCVAGLQYELQRLRPPEPATAT